MVANRSNLQARRGSGDPWKLGSFLPLRFAPEIRGSAQRPNWVHSVYRLCSSRLKNVARIVEDRRGCLPHDAGRVGQASWPVWTFFSSPPVQRRAPCRNREFPRNWVRFCGRAFLPGELPVTRTLMAKGKLASFRPQSLLRVRPLFWPRSGILLRLASFFVELSAISLPSAGPRQARRPVPLQCSDKASNLCSDAISSVE